MSESSSLCPSSEGSQPKISKASVIVHQMSLNEIPVLPDDDEEETKTLEEDLAAPLPPVKRKSIGISRSDPSFDTITTENNQRWVEKLKEPITIIQATIMKDKAQNVTKLFRKLEELSNALRDIDDFDPPELQEFVRHVLKIKDEINDIYEFSNLLMRDRLSARQMAFLQDLRYKFNPALDISVRFFGLDWEQMHGLMHSLSQHVAELCEAALRGPGRCKIILPSHLVRDLNKIQEDLVLHAEAVLDGRLNKHENDIMSEQQEKYRHFLEHLRERQAMEAKEHQMNKANQKHFKLKRFWPFGGGSRDSSRNGGRRTEEEDEDAERIAAIRRAAEASSVLPPRFNRRGVRGRNRANSCLPEETESLWRDWHNNVATYSKMASKVEAMELKERA